MPYGPDDETGTWMTKRELAAARRISIASADRLVRRMKWRKQPGNDGRARVLVPTDWASGPKDEPTDQSADVSRSINALELAVTTLREALQRSDERATRAEARARLVETDANQWWAQSRWRRLRAAWRGRT
jgi:hypothetical protein